MADRAVIGLGYVGLPLAREAVVGGLKVIGLDTREAETAKLLENTYRHVNIALVNEMVRFCQELDIDLPNIADLRESPAVPVAKHLEELGAVVQFHDPHVTTWAAGGHSVPTVPDLDSALRSADLTILLQPRSAYDVASIAATAHHVLDTRGVIPTSSNVNRL